MCASPLSTFAILVTFHWLLGTPGNLELRKRKGVARLTFNNVGLAGLVRDVDVGLTCDAASNDALCTGYVQRSLRRDPRADSEETLRYCHVLGLLEPEERNSSYFA